MRYKPEQKKETHQKIIDAAGRSFRKNGFSGIGVDGLAKEAGVTSGAFYKHFKSKKAAFESAVIAGLVQVQEAIRSLQAQHNLKWWDAFADFYVNERITCDGAESCGLQSLSPEVSRGDDDIKAVYETELLKLAALASGENNDNINDETWARLAALVGGVTIARSVKDPELSARIGQAVRHSALFK